MSRINVAPSVFAAVAKPRRKSLASQTSGASGAALSNGSVAAMPASAGAAMATAPLAQRPAGDGSSVATTGELCRRRTVPDRQPPVGPQQALLGGLTSCNPSPPGALRHATPGSASLVL